jgi:hypothetical protein
MLISCHLYLMLHMKLLVNRTYGRDRPMYEEIALLYALTLRAYASKEATKSTISLTKVLQATPFLK